MHALFDSRDLRYRSPFGAQPAGQTVFFRICLPREWGCSGAKLKIQTATADGRPIAPQEMFWAGMEGEHHEWWDCRFTPSHPAVYFYWFTLKTKDDTRLLVRQADGKAALKSSGSGPRWQLTCYQPEMRTPDWLAGGVIYQIFPDRFAASGTEKENVPADRILREDWGGQPEWKPDEQGEIRNKDYFGGDLRGIEQRLDYLASLGVTCLYLNPIFEAHSNHRYNTADYTKVDPLLGTQEEYLSLLRTAKQVGIRILLDGVFSHTGSDSVYFNQEGRYPEKGAEQSLDSPYASWFCFEEWPHRYAAWWGIATLPEVNETDSGFLEFVNGRDGVVRTRLREGAAGWRLDVADELPDPFLDSLYAAAKAENPEALVLGEVWEDASNKESYGHMRRYLLGGQMDSVMNYPFCHAILQYLRTGNTRGFFTQIMNVVENYPPPILRLLMNHIGTHDTERALTALVGEQPHGRGREWQATQRLSPEAREKGLRLLRLAAALQYTLPGVPAVYYGDEAGMEGYRDPFNRGCFPWGEEDTALQEWYRKLGQLRRACTALREGDFHPQSSEDGVVCFERRGEGQRLLVAVNAVKKERRMALPAAWHGCTISMGGGSAAGESLFLPALDCAIAVLPE